MSEQETHVVCYHCGKRVLQSEAFYIDRYDTYLCPKHYLDLLNGKPIRINLHVGGTLKP
jgi:hypothetical protein